MQFVFTVVTDKVYILDLAAKIDSTAEFICKVQWGDLEFPPPFGREAFPEVSANNLYSSSLLYVHLKVNIEDMGKIYVLN